MINLSLQSDTIKMNPDAIKLIKMLDFKAPIRKENIEKWYYNKDRYVDIIIWFI